LTWLKKTFAFSSEQTFSGPAADAIIYAVQDMFSRGAPTEWDYQGFNKTHYSSGALRQLINYAPGSEIPVNLLHYAAKALLVYKNTQLPQAVDLYNNLQQAIQQQTAPAQEIGVDADNIVKVLGKAKYGKIKLYIPKFEILSSATGLNKHLRQRATEINSEAGKEVWTQEANNYGKFDFELYKMKGKEPDFDTYSFHKDFLIAVSRYLQELNKKLAAKAKKTGGEAFVYDTSELDAYINQTDVEKQQDIQKQKEQQQAAKPKKLDEVAGFPLQVYNVSADTPFHMGFKFPPKSSPASEVFKEIMKFSFPTFDMKGTGEGDRWIDKKNWLYCVKGTFQDYVDFGNLAKMKGFDVSTMRTVMKEIRSADIIPRTRINGQLDGYKNEEDFRKSIDKNLKEGQKLYGPQEDGVEFLYSRNEALMGDQTGSGKTGQAVIAAKMRMDQSGGKTLIITLLATQKQWEREIQKFTNETDIYVPKKAAEFDVNQCGRWTIMTYPMFSAPKSAPIVLEQLKTTKFEVLIMDECHNVKNKSARTTRVQDLGQNVPFKWGLSATISANRPIDVWRQLKAVGHRLGDVSESSFRKNFAGQQGKELYFGKKRIYTWESAGPGEEEAAAMKLREWLTDNSGVYIRRTKKEMNPNLPNHLVQDLPVDLTEKEKAKLNKAIAERMKMYKDPSLAVSEMIAQRTELAVAKVPYTLSMIENVLAQDKKVLVFTCFIQSADLLEQGANALIKKMKIENGQVVRITGGDPNRDAKVQAFKTDPNVRVMVLSILAGGTGLDVPNVVDDVIINDYSWTPKDAEQSEGRAFRVTSENDVTSRYVVASGTVDEDFFEIVQEKRKLAAIIDHPKSLEELKAAKLKMQQLDQKMIDAAHQYAGKTANSWFGRISKIISAQLSLEETVLREAREIRAKYPQCSNKDKCLDATYELEKKLRKQGINCAIQFGTFNSKRHAWLDIWTPQGIKLLDITADQWDDSVPDIIFGKISDYPEYGWENN